MSDEQTINEMGSDPITSVEVNNEAPNQEADANSSDQQQEHNSVPYQRFQEVNAQKNEYKQQLDQTIANINEYMASQNATNQQSVQEEPVGNIETVEDVLALVDKKVQEKIAPIQKQRQDEMYTNTVKSYFSSNQEASQLKDQIDSYYDSLPDYRKKSIYEAVSFGDTSVLDEIKNTVSVQHNSNLMDMTNSAVAKDVAMAASPQNTKKNVVNQPTLTDIKDSGKKSGDFGSYFKAFASTI